jgi:heme-degrading monooxygenase HmoA
MSTNMDWQYAVVWEFRVRSGSEARFERVYGPDGEWARLFRQDKGYAGTELMRDQSSPGRYLTIDFWRSREEYEAFRQQHAEEYRHIDQKCEALTEAETALGSWGRVRAAG